MPSRTRLLRLYYFVFYAALGAYLPYFPGWLEAHGIRGFAMSSIMALWPLLGIVSPVVFGVVADRLALRGSLLRVAAVGALVPFSVIAALDVGKAGIGYWPLFGLMFVFAFFRAPLVSIADVTALESPGSYGRTRLFGSLGFMAMTMLGGLLLDGAPSSRMPLFVAAGLACTALVALRLPRRSARPPTPSLEGAARLLRSPDYLLFLVGAYLWYAAHVSYDVCFSLRLKGLGANTQVVGACWAIGVAAEILVMGRGHDLLSRFSPGKLLAFALAVTGVRFLLIGSIDSLGVLAVLQPLHGVTFAVYWIAALDLVKRRAPPGVLATAQSLFSMATALGSASGILAWGPLHASRGSGTVFFVAAGVAAAGTLAAFAQIQATAAEPARDS